METLRINSASPHLITTAFARQLTASPRTNICSFNTLLLLTPLYLTVLHSYNTDFSDREREYKQQQQQQQQQQQYRHHCVRETR
jgi:hypothetical protein